jgi:hypothetical protein
MTMALTWSARSCKGAHQVVGVNNSDARAALTHACRAIELGMYSSGCTRAAFERLHEDSNDDHDRDNDNGQ